VPPCWLTIRYHRVNVTIENQVATTRVDQLFVNETNRDLEGTYVFPLPEDAAVTSFSMFVDGEKLDGQVLTREEARALYESIVRRNRDPALLEYVGRGAFQARVFPVPAGGQRRLQLEYTQVLSQDSNLVRYVYPLNTERFSPRPLQQASVTVTIHSATPLKSIYSPRHDVSVTRGDDTSATVSWEAANVLPRQNFELTYGVSPDEVGIHVLSAKPAGEDGYFLLLAAPPVAPAGERIVPKDVSLVLDTSGSMAGTKIDQSKSALKYVLNRLNPQDRFNLVTFSSTVSPFAAQMQSLSERDRALTFVDSLVASGGTNINDALLAALKADTGDRPHTVVFVTDGLPTVGPQQPEEIVANAKAAVGSTGAKTRIFTFGVGYDVNTTLLDKLAADFGGVSAYVKPQDNLEEAISSFYTKVGTPVLTDLKLDFGAAGIYDVFPAQLPDLYAGGQLVVAGRYRNPGVVDVTLSGASAGQARRYTASGVTLASGPVPSQESLPRLWASRKIGFLLSEIRLHGASKELVDEIVALATRYGIATPYTSFFVPEPGQPPRPGVALPAPAAAVPFSPQAKAQAADALRNGITAAPTAGAAAVQNSEATNRLQNATSAPTESASNVQIVGDKTFAKNGDAWVDLSAGEEPPGDPAARRRIVFGSDDYFALLTTRPQLARYLAIDTHLLLKLDDGWYEIVDQ
jgi:Ca-activated chloride channel family protein